MQHWVSVITGRADFNAASVSARPKPPVPANTKAAQPGATQALANRRSEVLRDLFPKLATWFEDAMARARRNDIEQYLAEAKDIADLEDRMRKLQNRATVSWI